MSKAAERISSYVACNSGDIARLGELTVSPDGGAILYENGATFALDVEIALFLEGFASREPLVPFVHVLTMLRVLGVGMSRAPQYENTDIPARLFGEFDAAGRSLRNAGAFCAIVCSLETPSRCLQPDDVDLLVRRLRGRAQGGSFVLDFDQESPEKCLDVESFFVRFLARWNAVAPEVRAHWLRHGCAPVGDEAARIADEVRPPASLVDGVNTLMRASERLNAAVPLVSTFVGALSLPPRRLRDPELPLGGYADITTRGHPEQLLPSQFALEGLEFVRRFANRELLYFRKEEPNDPLREAVLVLVDQGARTWGVVRIALTAAAVALAGLAERRDKPLSLGFTSTPGEWLDAPEPAALAGLLEVSDLTLNPATLLGAALERECDSPRDVILLTHPRALDEPAVAEIAKDLPDGTRLFALTADESGQVTFSEFRRGHAVERGRFRVDLERKPPKPPKPLVAPTEWQGDIEPIGFPFHFGLWGETLCMAFDADGDRLVTRSRGGYLHLWNFSGDGGPLVEVLPRGYVGGRPFKSIEEVFGLRQGFAVVGRFATKGPGVLHYDLMSRRVNHFALPDDTPPRGHWVAYADLNCVVRASGSHAWAVDLDTGGTVGGGESGQLTSRAQVAANRAREGKPRNESVPVYPLHPSQRPESRPLNAVWFEPRDGTSTWNAYTKPTCRPMRDGRGLFEGGKVTDAQVHEDFALLRGTPRGESQAVLALVGGAHAEWPIWRTLSPHGHHFADHRATPDGKRLAYTPHCGHLRVVAPAEPTTPLIDMPPTKVAVPMLVEQGSQMLTILADRSLTIVRWDTGRLDVSRRPSRDKETVAGVTASDQGLLPVSAYDPERFRAKVAGRRNVVVDRFGQVFLFRGDEPDWFCAFIVVGDTFAAKLRDGTGFGPPSLLGGPQSPRAAETIGRALLESSKPVGRVGD